MSEAQSPGLQEPSPKSRRFPDEFKRDAVRLIGNRLGRWEPRARKRRPKPDARLTQPRHVAKRAHNWSKWF